MNSYIRLKSGVFFFMLREQNLIILGRKNKEMKKLIIPFCTLLLAFSCSKQEFTETRDSINKADSLFTKANQSLKTIESITKRIAESSGAVKKEVVPEIERQAKKVDSLAKNKSWKIDSMRVQVREFAKNVKAGSDVARTLDSANSMLKNGENALSVLSKTADRILQQTKEYTSGSSDSDQEKKPFRSEPVAPGTIRQQASLEIQVADLSKAKSEIAQAAANYNADIIAEKYSNDERQQQEIVQVRVPSEDYRNFYNAVAAIPGIVKSKTMMQDSRATESEVEIMLVADAQLASTGFQQTPTMEQDAPLADFQEDQGEKTEGTLTKFLLAVPLLLLCVIAVLIVKSHNNKRKGYVETPAEERFEERREAKKEAAREVQQITGEPAADRADAAEEAKRAKSDDDYSRFMPGNQNPNDAETGNKP